MSISIIFKNVCVIFPFFTSEFMLINMDRPYKETLSFEKSNTEKHKFHF